jgi:hypothetical protein
MKTALVKSVFIPEGDVEEQGYDTNDPKFEERIENFLFESDSQHVDVEELKIPETIKDAQQLPYTFMRTGTGFVLLYPMGSMVAGYFVEDPE